MQLLTKAQLWQAFAPAFNFELDEEQLLAEALKRGFVTKHSDDQYLVNEDY
jgi:hypothetical protein